MSIEEEVVDINQAVVIEEQAKVEVKKPDTSAWTPKTTLGVKVKAGDIKDIDTILDRGERILEPEIVDFLLPTLENDLLLIGQAKGKFGGGQRRIFRQTQKKTMEGNKPKFSTCAVVGNGDGFVGLGFGKSKETVPAREKSIRQAKLNIFKVRRGCGAWECGCKEHHSIPFAVSGKCGSSTIKLIPGPKGTGLRVEKECAKIMRLAGIKDAWSFTTGQTKTKINLVKACILALQELMKVKTRPQEREDLGIIEGSLTQRRTE